MQLSFLWNQKQRIIYCALLLGFFFNIGGCPPGTMPGNGNGTDPPPGQTLDADEDGVVNDDDDCANTAAGATVDENGCAVEQLDSDGDGVPNNADTCADTPANSTVGADGCPVGGPDADNDGVSDDDDLCADTSADDTTVDSDGCGDSQRDSDSDGVTDDADQCERTPEDINIDENGCPISTPGTPDADEDGVPDDIDICDDTADGAADVDANGCAPSQRDSDGDGFTDDQDMCEGTPDGDETVDDTGCAESQRDSDGDGVNDDADNCPGTPIRTTVTSDGCPVSTGGGGGGGGGGGPTGPVCGNNNLEAGEECDPPDGSTCDANCQNTTGGALVNDACGTPTDVTDGTSAFSNVGATTDGPADCDFFGNAQTDSDIWYCYTATCTDDVVVSLCGSLYDTKINVYPGCGCPSTPVIACSDDDCGPGSESRVTFPAIAGQQYMIRIGGFRLQPNDEPGIGTNNEQGTGTMSIFCESQVDRGLNACNSSVGDCFSAHAGRGCQDATTCTNVFAVDPYCGDTSWDGLCAQKADGIVNGFPTCSATSGSCLTGKATPGCDDSACCQSICESDPFCCLTQWDDVCASDTGEICGLFASCSTSTESCNTVHATPGCNNTSCCSMVCAIDPMCCNGEWDDVCTGFAATECR